jgi:hypothetical protein
LIDEWGVFRHNNLFCAGFPGIESIARTDTRWRVYAPEGEYLWPKSPYQSSAFQEKAALNPGRVACPNRLERGFREAQPKEAGDGQASEERPVVDASPSEARNRELEKKRAEDSNAALAPYESVGQFWRGKMPDPGDKQYTRNNCEIDGL